MRLRFPHPLTLLVGFIALVALLSWVLPAGQFDRRDDPVTGRKVVVAGTYHTVPQQPVTPFQAVVAIPKGKRKRRDRVRVSGRWRAREHAGGDHTAGAGAAAPDDAARIRSAHCGRGECRRGGSWFRVQWSSK